MARLNAAFAGNPRATDVLAFPSGDAEHPGDVALSLARVRSQARAFGHSVEREFGYLLTHALLHLAGLGHDTDARQRAMRRAEEQVLAHVGLPRGGAADDLGAADARRRVGAAGAAGAGGAPTAEPLVVPAPAKINLGLEVCGRRADGYHDVVTIYQALEFGDAVHLREAAAIEGVSSVAGLRPADDLAFRAAHALRARLGTNRGVYIHVEKRIPVAAGLAGGSSDAAATLLGLETLWGAPRGEVEAAARSLGADAAFFLRPGTALGLQRGDDLHPLPPAPRRWVLLVRPQAQITARAAYAELRAHEWSGGGATQANADALRTGRLDPALLTNDLQAAAARLVPDIAQVLHALDAAGAAPALLAGSGPTCFGLFPSEDEARRAQAEIRPRGWWTVLTSFLRPADAR